jgi:NADH-quinone oxidoreductase subunit N
LSLLVGAFGAITQTNIKRLLAYSSIGHVGFMMLAAAAGTTLGVQAVLVYLAVYVFMSAGMFGCVLMMQRGGEQVEAISSLAGLSKKRPLMAAVIAVFMFSMAGIPPLSGFFGKMVVVVALVKAGFIALAVVGVATSVVGCYYYLKVVKVMYFDESTGEFDSQPSAILLTATTIGTLVTLLFFLLPSPIMQQAKIAAEALIQ